jgi:hypothetical protein
MSWQALGAIEPAALSESRCQAHQAVQIIAAAGETLLPHSADTSHTALTSLRGTRFPGRAGS